MDNITDTSKRPYRVWFEDGEYTIITSTSEDAAKASCEEAFGIAVNRIEAFS